MADWGGTPTARPAGLRAPAPGTPPARAISLPQWTPLPRPSRLAAATGAIDHALTLGQIREAEVIAGLRPHIPERFRLDTGQVINAGGSRSLQQDVIISDALAGTPVIAEGGIGVFPVEIVYATLQVKSRITVATVAGAVENVASVKRLQSNDRRPAARVGRAIAVGETAAKPFGGIVAFASDSQPDALGRAYLAANPQIPVPQDRCNALVVLDELALLWATADPVKRVIWQPSAGNGGDMDYLDLVESHALLVFYVVLHKWLSHYTPPELDLPAYVGEMDGTRYGLIDLRRGA